jgi:hypothetical protein
MTLRARIRRPQNVAPERDRGPFDALGESLDSMTYDFDPENRSGHDRDAQTATSPAESDRRHAMEVTTA